MSRPDPVASTACAHTTFRQRLLQQSDCVALLPHGHVCTLNHTVWPHNPMGMCACQSLLLEAMQSAEATVE